MRYALAAVVALAAGISLSSPQGQQRSAIPFDFSGSTPCGSLVRAFLGIPSTSKCERVTWQLRLGSGTFDLQATHGMQAVNAPGFAAGAGEVQHRGTWSKGGTLASYSNSEIYRLLPDRGGRSLELALIDGTLLHILNSSTRLLPGDAGWSYTLTRAAGRAPARQLVPYDSLADFAGDFEGRTSCVELAALLGNARGDDCTKLKWGVTLFRDPATGALVYTLDPASGRDTFRLLRADADVLFFLDASGAVLKGNGAHSYTLNRSARAVTH